jgi:hypothetical protein
MVAQDRRFPEQRDHIIARAWAVEGFKRRLLAEPAAVLREYGLEVPSCRTITTTCAGSTRVRSPPTGPCSPIGRPAQAGQATNPLSGAETHKDQVYARYLAA